jgi:hypothetical protein
MTRYSGSSSRILLGSGRSGTTWIQDCLAESNALRPIFEPLHPAESTLGARCAYDVVTRESPDEELEKFFVDPTFDLVAKRWTAHRAPIGLLHPTLSQLSKQAFAKRFLKGWWQYAASFRRNQYKLRFEETLIKCIRANLMVDWLVNRMDYSVALIIRHPCAVVESQMRLGAVWDPREKIDLYRANDKLHALTDRRYEQLLGRNLSTAEALCLNWVIENQWPYENSKDGNYSVTLYEELLENPGEEWTKLCASLGLENRPTEDLVARPSQQSSEIRSGSEPGYRSASWQRNLNVSQLDEIQGILDDTNFHLYSVEEVYPL